MNAATMLRRWKSRLPRRIANQPAVRNTALEPLSKALTADQWGRLHGWVRVNRDRSSSWRMSEVVDHARAPRHNGGPGCGKIGETELGEAMRTVGVQSLDGKPTSL